MPVTALILTLFGSPTARAREAPGAAPLPGKALALLAYLALEPGPHTRESLATLLWGETDDEGARASLRQALKHLREYFGDAIVADRQTVALSGPVECDAVSFLETSRQSAHAAAAFDAGRFLSGFTVRGAPGFDEWLENTRQRLLGRFQEVMREEARTAVGRSRWREALEIAERWLASDPISEEATGVLVEALFCLQGRASALARYRRYCDLLKRELGVRPGEALTDLARRIELSPGPAEIADDSGDLEAPLTFETDLVGRESHWRALTAAWTGIADGHGRVVLVEGESGIGKTRLAEEFTRWAISRGATVLRGQGYEQTGGAPFGTIATALRGALTAPGLAGTDPEWLSEVSRLLPELQRRFVNLPPPAAPTAAGERWRLFEGVAQVLLTLAAERRTIVFLDDMQWCDAETCALVHFLLKRLEDAPVLLLATVTSGELHQNMPAQQLVQALASSPRAGSVQVTPLTPDEVWQLVRQMGNIRTPTGARRFAARLHDVSDGNPFQVIEIVKMLFAEGLLAVTPVSREWVLPATASEASFGVDMPRSVRDAIVKRIRRLPYELRDLLASIAVAGRPLSTEVLGHIHGMSRLRVAALTDALVERHLVEEGDGSYRMAHPLLGAVVRSELTGTRRTELHRALSLSLEASTRPERMGERVGEIAWHAERAGEGERAFAFALMASEHAVQHYGFEEALGWLNLALRAAPDARADIEARVRELSALAGWSDAPAVAPAEESIGISGKDVDLRVAPVGS